MGVTHGSISAACILIDEASPTSRGLLIDVRRVANHPGYHSPERATGAGISPSDDTWAIAVMLYHALTAQLPFAGDTDEQVRERILAARPAPVAVFGVDADAMQRVLDAALARDRTQRTSKVADLRHAVAAAAGDASLAMAIPLGDEDDGDDDEDDKTIVRAPLQTPPGGTYVPPRPAAGAPPQGPPTGAPPMGPALRPPTAPRPGAAARPSAPGSAARPSSPGAARPSTPGSAARPSAAGPAPRPSSTGPAPRPGQAARPSSGGARPSTPGAAPRPGQPMQTQAMFPAAQHTHATPQPAPALLPQVHAAAAPTHAAAQTQATPPPMHADPMPAAPMTPPASAVVPRQARTVPIPTAPVRATPPAAPAFPTSGPPFPGQGGPGSPADAAPPTPAPRTGGSLANLHRTMPLSAFRPPADAGAAGPGPEAWRPVESPSRTEAWTTTPAPVESPSRPEAWQPTSDPRHPPPQAEAWSGSPQPPSFPAAHPHGASPMAMPAPSSGHDPRLLTAPPSSASEARFVAAGPAPPPPRRSGGKWLLGIGAILAITLGGAGAFFLLPRLRASGSQPTAAPTVAEVAPAADEPAPGSTVSPDGGPTDDAAAAATAPATPPMPTDACLLSMFPADTWPDETKRPKLEFVCTERDPRRGAQQLRAEVARRTGAQRNVSEGMREWAVLGWYELAAFAVIRSRCCDAPEPLALPPEVANCPSFDASIATFAALAPRNGTAIGPQPPAEVATQIDAAMAEYDKSLRCIIRAGASRNYGSYIRPQGGEDTAFRKTLLRGLAR
jgi:hypothetical protein